MKSSKKKVAIYIPFKNLKEKSIGILTKDQVLSIEKILKRDSEIDFLGNVDLAEIKINNEGVYCPQMNLSKLDLFFWYGITRNEEKLEKLKILSSKVRVVKNPYAFENIEDKFIAHSMLSQEEIPTPEFELVALDDIERMKELLKNWKTLLIKPRRGNFGRGIIRIDDFETLRDIAGYIKMETGQGNIFVERFYENDLEDWISVVVINGRAVYGYRKSKSKYAGWKVYDFSAKGGEAYYVDPSPVREVAKKAASVLDSSIIGFDFIKTKKGYKIVDENNFPGFYKEAFDEAGAEVSDLIAELIITKAKNN